MDFLTAYKDFWVKYVDFNGTTSRAGYWMVFLINAVINMAIYCLAIIPAIKGAFNIISWIFAAATLIPSLSIAARRLHDTNKSALNLLWLLLPVVGWIILIVFLAQPATEQKYGTNQKAE